MRIARFTTGSDPRYAIVDGEDLVVLTGDPMYTPGQPTGERIALDDNVRLLAPVIPRSKAVCLGKNFAAHAHEIPSRGPDSEVPILFIKPNTAVIGPDDPIVLPSYATEVHLEGELALVVGRVAKNIAPENAAAYIYGYTCANDVTARDMQAKEDQWFRAKGFDTSLPVGPWIETDLAADDVVITSRIGDREVQRGSTQDMILDAHHALAMVSEVVTLLPGDLILLGTPAGVSQIDHADIVEIDIDGIGVLRNPVLRRD